MEKEKKEVEIRFLPDSPEQIDGSVNGMSAQVEDAFKKAMERAKKKKEA